MRRDDVIRLAALFIVSILLIIILIFLFGGGRGILSESFSADEIVNIELATDIGDIQITPHEGENIHVYLEGKTDEKPTKNYKLLTKVKENTLTIRAKRKLKLLSFGKTPHSYTVLIELPVKQYEQLFVEAEVANIHIESVAASESFIRTNVGNVTLRNIDGIINSATEVGDNTIELPTVSENISATSRVGNVIVKMQEVPLALQSEIDNRLGNTTINLPNAEEGSIGIDGPLLKLAVEVGNISVLLAES